MKNQPGPSANGRLSPTSAVGFCLLILLDVNDLTSTSIAFGGCGRGSLVISIEAQLPTYYNKGTSGNSHSNLDPMKVIMQELQLMRKGMKEMRGKLLIFPWNIEIKATLYSMGIC
ncbi:hypothetical protein M9H77_23424 [Catharanthus roseus]|uniref:Uncharacterized protein n=1 Tax=Catharanthus roseus TaxID=4058 RepID=A0ACC0ATZ8_CATRO|nr:hypothetical protein M9H77_23424 [Catharanthus roseus]